VSPLRGEKPQNWPLSKLNTGRFALRAMLPVMIPMYTSVDHSIGAIPMAERKLCASVDGNIC